MITLRPRQYGGVPTYQVLGKRKTDQRRFAAECASLWLSYLYKHAKVKKGAVMIDIDDTILDHQEKTSNGFQFMQDMYQQVGQMYPIHIVTARPDDQHDNVMRMLHKRGFCIQPDRLHMLPSELYGRSTRHVEKFKFDCYLRMLRDHTHVVARFGDKLWDVAHLESLDTYLSSVQDRDCMLFRDPRMRGTLSVKLPGCD